MVTKGWNKECADESAPTKYNSEAEQKYWEFLRSKRAT
jgi:hypothetical protein